jgi:hypothetical protein
MQTLNNLTATQKEPFKKLQSKNKRAANNPDVQKNKKSVIVCFHINFSISGIVF